MKSIVAFGLLFAGVFAGPQLERRACSHDNCLRAFIASSAIVAPFCSTYTTGSASATLPVWASACSNLPSRVSSACSCINTATSTTTQSSTTSSATPTSITSSVPPTSTSSAAPTSSSTTSTTSTSTSTSSSAAASTSTTPPWVRTTPPAGAIIVDGSDTFTPGIYPTVQEGVDALSPSTTVPQVLFIYPGTYVEQVYVPALKSNLTIQGYTLDARSYEGNTVTITFNLALENVTSDDLTATVRQWNPNTKVYNLNIANTFGHIPENGQNLALSAHTTNQGYYGVQLLGYQDTLLANTGNQLYAKSLITGAVDFIFGQTATAWLDQIDIRTVGQGCVTASGRAANNTSYYVINNSTVDGINSSIPAGDNYLGRPWHAWARVAFQYTYLGAVIAPAGWSIWSTSTPNTQNVTFAEYQNYGPGSYPTEGPRANFSEQLDSPVLIGDILGDAWEDEWWVDLSYVPDVA